jgi:hypothetical protein
VPFWDVSSPAVREIRGSQKGVEGTYDSPGAEVTKKPLGLKIETPAAGFFTGLMALADDQPWSNPLILLLAAGGIALTVLGWSQTNRLQSAAGAILVGGAALASGALLGFLFGIPRAVQDAKVSDSPEQTDRLYQVNTNLEQISDWLTKIIVGVGLVELYKIPPKFVRLAAYVVPAFGSPLVSSGLAAIVLMYFAVIGFLGAYLWTRLLLTLEFTRADRAARQSPAFYEGLVQGLLYQPAPNGFQDAIRNAQEYMRRFGEGNWRVWRSLACAYGQKYSYMQLQEVPADELSRTRDQALGAVKHVLLLNPNEREGIRALWDPELATEDNDLTPFFPDEDFKAILAPADGELTRRHR